MPEGMAGTPVCVSCYKALPIDEALLEEIGEAARQKLERDRPVATAIENFIAKVRNPGKNPLPAALAGAGIFFVAIFLFQMIFAPPPPPRELCKKGDLEACIALGYLYETDKTLQNGLIEALALYKKACSGGSDEGCRTVQHFLASYPGQVLTCAPHEERCLKVRERWGG